MSIPPPLDVAPEVADALAAARPVVALESTIITHGMPAPENLETARAVEADIRAGGAVPATIAVLNGRIKIGLGDDLLEAIATTRDVLKLSRADLAVAIANGQTGSTTVAATMIAARAASIQVFATGGIGGVHRDGATSFDISADLDELAQTGVVVVCAGAKAILDIPLTLEALETRGVPVIAYGTDELPAFWSRRSGVIAPLRADDPAIVARGHAMRAALGIPGGTLVCNPVPLEHEIPFERVSVWIDRALGEASDRGVAGKEVTPFLLARINELSNGDSLRANIALVRNNARLAAKIAVALSAP